MGEGKITRVVLDTNTIISAFGWNGNERKLLSLCIGGDLKACMSYEIFKEVERVIDYPKLKFTGKQKKRFIRLIFEVFEFVEPIEKIDLIREDPDDNKIIECAVASSAQYIVSGNRHLLDVEKYRDVKIVKCKDLLDEIEVKK